MISRPHEPATVEQLAGAIAALGLWSGDPESCDHQAEAERLGGELVYRARLGNYLLGAVEAKLVEIEGSGLGGSWEQAFSEELRSTVREEDYAALFGFLRWQSLRVAHRVREMASRDQSGPLVLAAAHAADALQWLLSVLEQGPGVRDMLSGDAELDDERVMALPGELARARESLQAATGNVDVMADMLDAGGELRGYGDEDLEAVEVELLEAGAAQRSVQGRPPERGVALLLLSGSLGPVAIGLRARQRPGKLREHVARLGAAAATFLISLSGSEPSPAMLDSARRHVIVAVLHGGTGISRVPVQETATGEWFLRATQAVGALMSYTATGRAQADPAYTSTVTGYALEVLSACAAGLVHHRG